MSPYGTEPPLLLTRRSSLSIFIAHASSAARACGVRPGMSLGEAQALCPRAHVVPHEPHQHAKSLEHLAMWAQRFSPVVRSAWPESVLLDVTGCERLFRGEESIIRRAVAGLAEQHVRARGAIADTIGAAWALAHAGHEPIAVAPVGQSVPRVVGLPPSALRLDEDTVAKLDALGIRTIGDLLMLPRATLPSRFGEVLVQRLQQMLGEIPEWLDDPRPAPVFAARMSFGPSDSYDVLQAAMQRVADKLCERLVAGDVAARRLLCVIYFEQRQPLDLEIGLSRPSRDVRHLRNLLAARLETVDLSTAACGLMVYAVETAAWHPAQGGLFEAADRSDDEAVGELLDRLANRLGAGAVARAESVEDHQPERAFRYVPVIAKSQNVKTPKSQNTPESMARRSTQSTNLDRTYDPPTAAPGARPLVLFARPQPVSVMAIVPEGPPVWFRYRGCEHRIARAAGPERIETGWWRGADIRRDYYRVTTESGQQFWLFRDLQTADWFLHGSYE